MSYYKAPRRYSNGRNFGVETHQGFAADIVPRRPYGNRMNKGPNKWSRNLVWTASDDNMPRKNGSTYGSTKPQGSGTSANVSEQQMKNAAHGQRGSSVSDTRRWGSNDKGSPKSKECVCKFWKAGNCKKGDQCSFLHSWTSLPGMVMVAALEGHKKDLKGIALPQGSDKLFSASSDGTLKIWDCHTGQCAHTINLQAEAGSLMSEGPWVFLGLPNAVKAFNVQTSKDLHLNGVVGQVRAMTVGNGMLFVGTSSGSISVWKATNSESDPFTYLTSLEGHHSGEVTCFIVGGQQLYSGSVDKTIKVWDLNTLECTTTLRQHTDTVTSLLCWDQYLISSSLDGTIKVWACSENGSLKVTNTRRQGQSVHTLSGITDAEDKPIVFCSYENGTVSICDLPSFEERGKMFFSTNTVGTITIGPDGLLFTGDKSGKLRVWSLAGTKV
ncbi:Zinc finger CCCH domain-containing protein 59 [Raphanus sativus]|nr:zinc finger CCCH domain-containing protein 59-like isoform X1 [Raphanus sativus]XP_056862704.1 zinc finger CCCH domain-containing protein 59-like isoform X1 [Raphanus sativus]KAJ4901415.1 Zinc finger CCCH domain-containing protein 59 [Raphanus sativus]